MDSEISISANTRFRSRFLAAVAVIIGSSLFAANALGALAHNTFDADKEFWDAVKCDNPSVCFAPEALDIPGKFRWNIGGYLETEDPDSDHGIWMVAPDGTGGSQDYLSNLAPGQKLIFDMRITNVDGTGFFDNEGSPFGSDEVPFVTIIGGGKLLIYFDAEPLIGDGITPSPWFTKTVPIDVGIGPGTWWSITGPTSIAPATAGDLTMALNCSSPCAGPDALFVNGEFLNDSGDLDTVDLDNVNLVPVPAALPLLISALAGLGFAARRKV